MEKVINYKSCIFHRALQLRYQVVKNICWQCVGDQIIGTSRPKSQENQFSDGRMHWNELRSLTKNPTLCTIVVVPELTAITYRTHLSIVSHPYIDKQCIITCYILKYYGHTNLIPASWANRIEKKILRSSSYDIRFPPQPWRLLHRHSQAKQCHLQSYHPSLGVGIRFLVRFHGFWRNSVPRK